MAEDLEDRASEEAASIAAEESGFIRRASNTECIGYGAIIGISLLAATYFLVKGGYSLFNQALEYFGR